MRFYHRVTLLLLLLVLTHRIVYDGVGVVEAFTVTTPVPIVTTQQRQQHSTALDARRNDDEGNGTGAAATKAPSNCYVHFCPCRNKI